MSDSNETAQPEAPKGPNIFQRIGARFNRFAEKHPAATVIGTTFVVMTGISLISGFASEVGKDVGSKFSRKSNPS